MKAVDPSRGVFGRRMLGELGVVRQQLSKGRAGVEMARLLVLAAAASLDVDAQRQHQKDNARPSSSSSSTSSLPSASMSSLGESNCDRRSGLKSARTKQLVALIKATVPKACERVIDDCLQIFGGAGVCQVSHSIMNRSIFHRNLQ